MPRTPVFQISKYHGDTVFALIYGTLELLECQLLIIQFALIHGMNEFLNHSIRSNGQVLLSFISRLYYQLLPMERYVAATESSIRLE